MGGIDSLDFDRADRRTGNFARQQNGESSQCWNDLDHCKTPRNRVCHDSGNHSYRAFPARNTAPISTVSDIDRGETLRWASEGHCDRRIRCSEAGDGA
jgi:hypothetical protein